MTISIVIPVYNVASYLRECLRSVTDAAQAIVKKGGEGAVGVAPSVEIICVDDGSTDGSGAILDELKEKLGRASRSTMDGSFIFRVLHQPNAGVSAARNAGMAAATGDWLYFMDADDVLLPGGLEKMAELVADDRYDAVFLGDPILFTREPPPKMSGTGRIIASIDEPRTGKNLLLKKEPLWGYPFIRLLRRSLFAEVKFPVGVRNLEDSLSLIDVLAVRARWLWVDWRVYGYRDRKGSACHEITVEKVLEIIPRFAKMYESARDRFGKSAADRLLRQYRGSVNYYVDEIVDVASVAELRQVVDAYDACREVVGFPLIGRFNRVRFAVIRMGGGKFAWRQLRCVENRYRRAYRGLARKVRGLEA